MAAFSTLFFKDTDRSVGEEVVEITQSGVWVPFKPGEFSAFMQMLNLSPQWLIIKPSKLFIYFFLIQTSCRNA